MLKDEETLAFYKLQNDRGWSYIPDVLYSTKMELTLGIFLPTDTIHMVRSNARSAPVLGNPSSSAPSASTNSPSSAPSAAQQVPSTFGAGQAFGSDPLAALNRADFAGPHMASLNRELFQGMGMNPNDPNMLMTAMQSDEFRTQMRNMLQRPEVVDQIIASNPQLSQMPGIRDLFRSEEFREYLLDPQSMARAAELSRGMGMGGMGGMGGFGGGMGGMEVWEEPVQDRLQAQRSGHRQELLAKHPQGVVLLLLRHKQDKPELVVEEQQQQQQEATHLQLSWVAAQCRWATGWYV